MEHSEGRRRTSRRQLRVARTLRCRTDRTCCASNIDFKPWWTATLSRRDSAKLTIFGDATSAAYAASTVPHRKLRLPCSFKGVGGQLFVRIRSARKCRNGSKPRSPAASLSKGDIAADVPRPTTGHNRNTYRQHP